MKRNTLGVTLLKCLLLFLIHEACSPTLNSNAAQLAAADTTLITNLKGHRSLELAPNDGRNGGKLERNLLFLGKQECK